MMKTRNTFVLSLLALALILSAVISPALAYFTDQDQATGAIPITLGGQTEINDTITGLEKTISIKNTEGRDVWVRLLVAVGDAENQAKLTIKPGDYWEAGGDYWYYNDPVSEGETTTPFIVNLSQILTDKFAETQTEFNVAVLYETTPVQYDEKGNMIKGDGIIWSVPLDFDITSHAGTAEGGEGNG